jgi:cbb3-type cytochrome oxidase maturation protein
MEDFDVLGPYLIALLMSMGALAVFVWGVLAGTFDRADEAALRFFRMEMDHERRRHSNTADQ